MANIPQPHHAHAMWASSRGLDSSLASLESGRHLYVMKCDGCHSLYSVNRVTTQHWPAWIDSMRSEIRRANGVLTENEAASIRNYLVVASGYLADSLAAGKQESGGDSEKKKTRTPE